MQEPAFELTVNPKRLAFWAGMLVGLDASDHDLGRSYDHHRFPVLKRAEEGSQTELVFMRQASTRVEAGGSRRETAAFVTRDDLLNITHLHRALRRRRCIVPADRIFGLHHKSVDNDPRCTMLLQSGQVFGMAAIWELRADNTPHFSVITTLVSATMHSLAECTPVIVSDRDRERWLDHTADISPDDLLRPLSEAELGAWTLTAAPCTANAADWKPYA